MGLGINYVIKANHLASLIASSTRDPSSYCNYVTQLITSMSVRIRSTKNILILKFTL